MALGMVLGLIGGVTGAVFQIPPIGNYITKETNSLFPNAPLPVNQLLTLRMTWGYSDDWFKSRMAELGYSSEVADQYLQSAQFYPTPQDIISLTTRGALWESSQEKWSEMFKPPDVAVQWAKKAGLSEDVLSKYWFAHFSQPSWFRLRDMYFRGIISDDVMDDALEYQGYSEYWRPKLKKVMQAVPTRTDVRRMHKLGIISDEDVYKYFKWRYYSDEDAKALQQWVIQHNKQSNETNADQYRNMTRTMIEDAYKDHIIQRDKALKMLQNINYSKSDAELILQMDDYEMKKEEIDTKLDYLREAVKNGKLDINEAITKMNEMGLPAYRQEYLKQKWLRESQSNVEIPSKSDLMDFLKKQIIDKDTFKDLMRKHGYRDSHIDWYIKSMGVA